MSHNSGKCLLESEKQNTWKKKWKQSLPTFKIKSKVTVSWMHKQIEKTGDSSAGFIRALTNQAPGLRSYGRGRKGAGGANQWRQVRWKKPGHRRASNHSAGILQDMTSRRRGWSMTDDLIDGQWKQIYFLIPLPPSRIKSPWIYSFFPLPPVRHSFPLPFFSLTLLNSHKRAFSLLAFLLFPPQLVYPRMLIADPATFPICCRGMLTSLP